jgi:tetratricopeptide (TPR) repeat protein
MADVTGSFLRMETVFHEALAADEAARPALIERGCGGDAALISEVTALLRACAMEEQVTAARQSEPPANPEGLPNRTRVGPYQIDRLLGRGGMGAVYLAHRADGQFEQQVAIKLIDLPLATDLFRERFRQERQILAGLQHPLIARLLDGGVTAEGDLYLAMEYVAGTSIHRFCEEKRLPVRQRLALFKSVCEAVQFAHQNFVVHRDLKPDNILVAEDGTPRLLDFGTAKLLSPSPANSGSQMTREGFQSFTPQYASPEQVLGNPITTASDTYSLGVLLYLLLAGRLPYELHELTTAEMIRVICEEPVHRPILEGGSQRRLDADLEAILLKALRKEPRERYLTAEQFASDVQAYLDGQPVAARRGTLRYRTTKFVHRHRLALAGTVLLAITLVAGIAGVLWQARVANLERRKAEARSADLRQLSNSLLSELDEAIKQLPGSTGVQKLLVTRVLEHLDRMAKDAKGDRQTQLDLIDAYTRLGNIQGNAYDQNLGDPAGALVSLDKALAIAQPIAAAGSKDREAIRALAAVQQSRSEILWQTDRTPEAIPVMRAAVESFDTLVADPHTSATLIAEASGAYSTLGDELGQTGTASLADTPAALAAYRHAIILDERAAGVDPTLLRAKRGLSIVQLKIGSTEMETDPAQALKDFQLALQRADALPASEQGSFATLRLRSWALRKQAITLVELGEYDKAFPLFAEGVKLDQRFADADAQDWRALADLQVILEDEAAGYEDAADPASGAAPASRRQNLENAERLLMEASGLLDRMLQHDPANDNWKAVLADAQVRIGAIRQVLYPANGPQPLSKKGIATLKDLARREHASPMILDMTVGALLKVEPASLKDPQFAVACAERGAALSHRLSVPRLLSLAQAYHAAGQLEKARATANQALALLPPYAPGDIKPRLRKLLEVEAR